MRITGTFLDEISHDIPHQNWGAIEWENDFRVMKSIGIDTVIMIRSGHKKWQTFPSKVLTSQGCHPPSSDLVDLFLSLAERHNMKFYFGLYDAGIFFETGRYQEEIDINVRLIDEVWQKYGHRKAFSGWYVSQETSRYSEGIINIYATLGGHCKQVSDLPVLISPFIDGRKAIFSSDPKVVQAEEISPEKHFHEWDEILSGIKDSVDIVAFQDGQVAFEQLPEFLEVNTKLVRSHGMISWSNTETFDRDMPIKFPPIKWDKLALKLEAAASSGVEKVITFEFSHFMSPNSSYRSAGHLFDRYCDHFDLG